MEDKDNSSVLNLVHDLSYCVWRSETQVDTPNSQTHELPETLKRKLVSQSFDILLKQKNLCLDDLHQNKELSYLLFEYFYKQVKQGLCSDHDRELYNNYVEDLENIATKYEAANSVFTLIAALSGSKPKKKIKPNEMLDCFHLGSLKHCVRPDQRSQTLQDQFDILHTSDSNANVSLFIDSSSFASHNPFRIPKIFEFTTDPILLHLPSLNANVPRVLNIPDRTAPVNQDEGYFTPDSANILEASATPRGGEISREHSWPQPAPPTSYSEVPAWNTLANRRAPREKQFVLDFQPSRSGNNAGQHLVQVLQSGSATPSPVHTNLFTHLKSNQVFARDLKYLLMGIPSRCFPFDKEKNQFVCAYGIHTEHISPDFLVNFLQSALQCGNYALLLRNLDKRLWTQDKKKGYVFLSFYLCIQENLRSYDTQVLSHLSPESQWTYVELQEFVSAQHRRLSTLARLVQQEAGMLLNHVYAQALDSFCTNQSAELNVMVARIFECCTNTYFELLEKWVYRGECHDSLVTQSSCHSLKSRLFWVKGFRFNRIQCPVFLLDHEDQIFACGKNISLLKLTNPEDPLFSIDPSKLPQLKCYLTRESVAMFHAHCKAYEASVLEACGEAPSLAKLLSPREYSQEQLRLWQEQATAKREAYIQQLQGERLKKRELQAEVRRKMLQEIENIEAKKKKAKEEEMAADLKIMEEAKRMDEEYVRMKEQEKLKIEEYYRSLMEMIERRSEHVKSRTQSLEAMRTILKSKVSKEKPTPAPPTIEHDVTDAKTDTPLAATSDVSLTNQTSSTSSSSVTSTDANCGDEIMSIFTLDIPEPPNVELLMKKIEEEEEAILLTRETQRRLEMLKANRLQARANRSRVLSSEYNLCTGEKTAKQAPMFDLAEKFNENNTTSADDEARGNKARADGSAMSDCMWNIDRSKSEPTVRTDSEHMGHKEEETILGKITEEALRKDSGSKQEKEVVSEHHGKLLESILETRESARRIKQKVLSYEFDIAPTAPETKDVPDARDGTTREMPAGANGETRTGSKEVVLRSEKKVLSAHEEMVRNRNKVLSQEFHLKEAPSLDRHDQGTAASQEARSNRDRSEGGSSMSACMQNQTMEPSKKESLEPEPSKKDPNQVPPSEEFAQRSPNSPTTQPSHHSATSSSENLTTVISNEESTPSHSEPIQGSGSDKLSPTNPNQCKASGVDGSPSDTNQPSSEISETAEDVHYKINTGWSYDSLISDNHDLDVTLVQKYLDASIRTPLYVQYRLTNDAILRLFLNKHHLASHLITLRNYFFLLDGSFAKSLTRDLSQQIRTNLVLLLNPFKLNSILRKAVDYGTCDTRMGQNLTFVMKNMDTIESLQESNVFQYVSLSYKVDWPVNIVLTPDALTNYDKVFVFLMQVQQVSHTLQRVFVHLKLRRRLEEDNLYVFRQINLFRHVMMQVLSAVQSYIHCSVLELPWHDMVEAFQKPVTLDSVYYRHVEYVKQIIFRCLLNKRSRSLTEALNAMFKNILEFYEELKRRPLESNYESLLAIFQKFLKISLYFHDYCRRMVTVGYQEQNLDYLLHMLSLNDYFSKAIPKR